MRLSDEDLDRVDPIVSSRDVAESVYVSVGYDGSVRIDGVMTVKEMRELADVLEKALSK